MKYVRQRQQQWTAAGNTGPRSVSSPPGSSGAPTDDMLVAAEAGQRLAGHDREQGRIEVGQVPKQELVQAQGQVSEEKGTLQMQMGGLFPSKPTPKTL